MNLPLSSVPVSSGGLRPSRAAAATLLVLSTLAASPAPAAATERPRERIPFNADWRFVRGDPADAGGELIYERFRDWLLASTARFTAEGARATTRPGREPDVKTAYVRPDFDDSGWRRLNLPHDWAIEGPFMPDLPGETGKLPWVGVGWYRKHFVSPPEDAQKRVYLDVDGAMAYATVWLNGRLVGGWPYGYASFRLDLTPHLNVGGANVLSIRLDNPPASSRWYPGSGLYRNVWLVKTVPIHVAQWGTFVTTPVVSDDAALVEIRTVVENHSTSPAQVAVKTTLYELAADGRTIGAEVASGSPVDVTKPVEPGRQALLAQTLTVRKPKRWSLKNPQRYLAIVSVTHDGKTVDRYETPFGIRTIAFDPNRGFLLNGERVPIQGVCNHHDLGALGAALNVRALERQLELLHEMGCNAIRTSHNPPAPELLELCDRMGFLVMAEAFDCWATGKNPNDYGRLFPDWHERDLRAMIRRDRNHPSVVIWSVGNEVREQEMPEAWKLNARLTEIAHGEDRTRPVTVGHDAVPAGFNGLQTAVDVFGYNYKPAGYAAVHERAPYLPLIGTETQSTVSSRGEYFFPVSDDQSQGWADFQISSYDLSAPHWACSPDVGFKSLDQHPYVAGEFVWTGFDYLGEPTPYKEDATQRLLFTDPARQAKHDAELASTGRIRVPSRSSYFGILDLAGFKKDRFYLYQARWRPELPMVHILPHWNWPERLGEVTPVHVYTSGDEVELFLNGTSLGRKRREPFTYRFRWDDVRYVPGELRAVAFKNGKRWAEEIMRTSGPAAKLSLTADRRQLRADGVDLAFITVAVTDERGVLVPRARPLVRFRVDGPGEIVATDNGDATSFESFQSPERHAYNGLALAIVRTRAGAAGPIHVSVESDALAGSEVTLDSALAP